MGEPIARPRLDPSVTPFEETRAFRRFGAEVMPEPDAAEEPYAKAIIEDQGFDGLPHVVPSRQLDRYVAAGETELFRSLTDAVYAEAFRMEDFFVGRGSYGSGTYAFGGEDALARARRHVPGGVILRMTLKVGARVADYDQLQDAAYQARERAIWRLRAEQSLAMQRAAQRDEIASPPTIRRRFDRLVEAEHAKYDDLGRHAAYLGFDAIQVTEREYYIVLNRTAVRVQKENVR